MDISFFNYLAPLLVVLLSIIVSLLVLLLWKVRKIHLISYELRSNARMEAEVLFAQIQALFALEKKLGLDEALPPMRGWAGSPDFLLAVADEVLARKPTTVMECSSGVSTLICARCLQINGSGHVYSLEHDSEFAYKTRNLLDRYGLADWATVLDAPLKTEKTGTPWYAVDAIPHDLEPIEMLIVDGPPMSTCALARFPALPQLMSRMADRFIVFVDDANRDDEIEILKQWLDMFPHLQQSDGYCEKGLVKLESKGKMIDSIKLGKNGHIPLSQII